MIGPILTITLIILCIYAMFKVNFLMLDMTFLKKSHIIFNMIIFNALMTALMITTTLIIQPQFLYGYTEIGQTWQYEPSNPFDEGFSVFVVDIKQGRVQYLFMEDYDGWKKGDDINLYTRPEGEFVMLFSLEDDE